MAAILERLQGFAPGQPFDDLELEPMELPIEALHPNSGQPGALGRRLESRNDAVEASLRRGSQTQPCTVLPLCRAGRLNSNVGSQAI